MNVLVIYHSRSGHTREAAEAIAEAARGLNGDVTIKSVAEVGKADVDRAETIFIGTWVHGLILFGVRPAGVDQWLPSLPMLNGKQVGIFCTYAFHPRGSLNALGERLKGRGAAVRGQHAFHRSQPTQGADQFVRSVMQAA